MSAESAATAPRRGPGRPRRDDLPENRRRHIVRSAYAVLAKQGYDRTSIADIARHAQVGHGTVYRYFTDKRDLLDHVFDYAVAKTVAALDLASLTDAHVADFAQSMTLIELFGWRLFALIDTDPGLLQLITVQSSAIDPELRYRVVGMIAAMDAAMEALFEAASPQWATTVDPRVRTTFGHMMLAMTGPGLVLSLLTPAPRASDRRACLATITAIADRGLLTRTEDTSTSTPPAPSQAEPGAPAAASLGQRHGGGATDGSTPSFDGSPSPLAAADLPSRRRAELYDAAWTLFLQSGYRDVDVADITARAGLSQGSFYNYFPNKRALLDLMIADVQNGIAHAITNGASPAAATTREDFVAALQALALRVITHLTEHAPQTSFIALTAPGVDQDAFTTAVTGFLDLSARLQPMLSHGREHGWIRHDVTLEVAAHAAACCIVAAVLPALLDDALLVDTEVTAAVCSCYLLGGMRAASRVNP